MEAVMKRRVRRVKERTSEGGRIVMISVMEDEKD